MVDKKVIDFAKYVANCAGMDAEKINVYDYDLRRVYFTYNNAEYGIRTWNINNYMIESYTLYKYIPDETGSHGEEVYSGENYIYDEKVRNIREQQEREIEIKTTIYNMVSTLISEEFYQWMEDNWATIEKLDEFDMIMDYYIHGENSAYAY